MGDPGLMGYPGLGTTVEWLRTGSARCRTLLAGLSDRQAGEPSGLPGWTRAELITHLARNADALVNLLTWARTGVPSPMYAGAAQRAADIAAGAGRPAAAVRADFEAADDRLLAAVAGLPEDAWAAPVRTAQGREVTAALVPWLRVRELWVHAADLRLGGTLGDAPDALVDALLDEASGMLTGRVPQVRARLSAVDRGRDWHLGAPDPPPDSPPDGPQVTLSGAAADLLAWLIGRAPAAPLAVAPAGATVPEPPPWL